LVDVPRLATSRTSTPVTVSTTFVVALERERFRVSPNRAPSVMLEPSLSADALQVVGSDPHGFDGDNDGVGCES